ncbi:hypothetical protein JHK87_006078 [Glycine soja]|nr:hypothetical protein JHK87_006078 [Glycine soja]
MAKTARRRGDVLKPNNGSNQRQWRDTNQGRQSNNTREEDDTKGGGDDAALNCGFRVPFKMALGGTAPPRGSAAATASMRRRRTTGGAASGGAAGTMLQFYTDDAPGLKISPNVVLVMSIGFIAFVAILHVMGKLYFVRREA